MALEQSDPLSNDMVDYLYNLKRETQFLDYKRIVPSVRQADFPTIVKDAMAFANNGGGYIFIGVDENRGGSGASGKFTPVGLPDNFDLEPASLNEKINSFTDSTITVDYRQFERTIDGVPYRFGVLYVEPARKIISARKDGKYADPSSGKIKHAFRIGDIYTRRGTQSRTAAVYEIDQINQKADQRDYQISVLSGQPDKGEEKLYSNLFPIKCMPESIYVGRSKFQSRAEVFHELREMPGFLLDLTILSNRELYSFQNLNCGESPYSELVHSRTTRKVATRDMLRTNKNIVLSLMNKEILACGTRCGMHASMKDRRLFYATDNTERRISWASRFRNSSRIVAKSMYAAQLGREVFVHPAVRPSFVEIDGKFYLQLDTSIVLTEDGKRIIRGTRQGQVVTRLVYKSHNLSHLTNILFWVHQLGCGADVVLQDGFVVSHDPVTATCEYGLSWDIQVGEIRSIIKDYRPETEPEELVIEHV